MDWLNSNTMLLARKTLDVSWARQKATLDNIANVDTPDYKAKYILVEDELKEKLRRVQGKRPSEVREVIQGARMRVRQSDEESIRMDGNNVNMDVEQVEVVRNSFQYQYALRQISDQLSRLRSVIEGR